MSLLEIPTVHDRTEPPLGPFWEPLRIDRVHRRRLRKLGADKRRAVVTIVHNEPVFLPIWLGYYSRFFAPEDIYVLDNDSTDGSTDGDGFVRVPAPHDSVDHTWMVETVQGLQHELIDRYDVVLVTDVDEIVSPTPEWGTLTDYIDEFDEWFVNCIGYELLHLADREPPSTRLARSWISGAIGSRTAATTSRRLRAARWSGCRVSTTELMGRPATTPTCTSSTCTASISSSAASATACARTAPGTSWTSTRAGRPTTAQSRRANSSRGSIGDRVRRRPGPDRGRADTGGLEGTVLSALESRRNLSRVAGARLRGIGRRLRRVPDPIRYRRPRAPGALAASGAQR